MFHFEDCTRAWTSALLPNKAMLLRSDQEARIVLGDNNDQNFVQETGHGESGLENGLTDEQNELGLESPIHPLGIKPSGNKLLSTETTDAREAIGAFQALPDGTENLVVRT